MSMFKRVFSKRNPSNITKSIRITDDMANALQYLADEAGETLNSYIVLILDQYLQVQLEEGTLPNPVPTKGEKPAAS